MRGTLSALLVVFSLVVAAVAGPALWLQNNVVEEKGFVELAGPLGGNKEFQEGLSALLAEQTTASLNLPPQLNELAGTLINAAARGIYTQPGYEAAWTEVLQRSHKLTFDAAGNPAIDADILLDLAPLVTMIVDEITADIRFTIPTPDTVVITVEQPQAARILPLMTTLGGWGGWLAAAAVGLLVAGIVLARRRPLTLLLAGVGLGAVALVWLIAAGFVQTSLAGWAVGPGTATQMGAQLGDLARDSWQGGINVTFILAGLIAAAGGATLMVARSRTT